MSEVYNPQMPMFEQLERLEIEARQLSQKREKAATDEDRAVIDKQVREVEGQITRLQRYLRK